MIKTLLVDDEASGRKVLEELIKLKHPEIHLLPAAAQVEEALVAIDQYRPDLVFLDIKLGNRSGFEVLYKTDFKNFHVVFVTAYDEFALDAIKVSALDYLLKPVSITELADAIEKFKKRSHFGSDLPEIKDLVNIIQDSVTPSRKRIVLLTKEGYELIPVSEIMYLKADHNYTEVCLQDKVRRLVTRNLGSFERELDTDQFMRIHKSHMVNLSGVRTYIPGNGGFVIMNDGQRFEVSRRKKKELLSLLQVGDYPETGT